MKKLLVLEVAALGYALLRRAGVEQVAGLPIQPLKPAFPAVTCTAQATLRTGLSPEAHGMPANGRFFRETNSVAFWNQSAALVKGARIWEPFRARGGRVGLYFFQQSLGEAVDEVLSPAPIHTHGGGMIMATYQQPEGMLKRKNPIPLWRYWGPLASPNVGWGIVKAVQERLESGSAPEWMMVYLPTLDYDFQRFGTRHRRSARALEMALAQIEALAATARAKGYAVAVKGDYAIRDVSGPVVYPNRVLREAGFFATRPVKQMRYPDFYQSRAVAVCDHQTALIYCREATCKEAVRACLAGCQGVAQVHEGPGGEGPDWILEAQAGAWFAWPWWHARQEAPDYAVHVDIHNKPGFDPCELFFGRVPWHVSQAAERIRGTHGGVEGEACAVALASEVPVGEVGSVQEWVQALAREMNQGASFQG